MFKLFAKAEQKERSNRWIFGTMLAFGIVGLIASFVLAVEEFHLLKNPDTVLSCSFNLVLNCAEVMKTWQASVFGFPNMFIGLMAFPVVIVVASLGLSKAVLPRWFYIGANIGYLLGLVFAYWLFFNSVYVIEVLCPWCLVVTFTTTMLFATITHYNLRENTFGLSKSANKKAQALIKGGYHKLIVASWIVAMIALVVLKFGDALFA
ncbi:MAG TPA: vitamin K epoxide reductase family protein [Candidatus Saccharimonadales bacterium]